MGLRDRAAKALGKLTGSGDQVPGQEPPAPETTGAPAPEGGQAPAPQVPEQEPVQGSPAPEPLVRGGEGSPDVPAVAQGGGDGDLGGAAVPEGGQVKVRVLEVDGGLEDGRGGCYRTGDLVELSPDLAKMHIIAGKVELVQEG